MINIYLLPDFANILRTRMQGKMSRYFLKSALRVRKIVFGVRKDFANECRTKLAWVMPSAAKAYAKWKKKANSADTVCRF